MSHKLNTPPGMSTSQAISSSVSPEHPVETEVQPGATRRTYTVAYKLKVLEEADSHRRNGTLGSWLRREGLYNSHLTKWEQQRREGLLDPENPVKRGPLPDPERPLRHELESTRRQLARAEKELEQAREIIAIPAFNLTRKLCTLFGLESHENSGKP